MPDQIAMWPHANLISVVPNWSSDVLVSWARPSFFLGSSQAMALRTVRLIPKYSQYHCLIASLLRNCSYRIVV